ncbi:hypothetical protein CIRG_04164 [Coccidioides immitis RMSCC 2394]|uniref:RRM domain-containing protein n=1 Tax=Coccidioides immitis RMSCC 2394 TaxID=404692 RepID=A0A0J6YCD2_COCIT|nr:hypothetical protein CIRG_04164 [Coccidioides immitis RMSCC 2394]
MLMAFIPCQHFQHELSSASRRPDVATVTILKSEYDSLARRSCEYERLKQALIRGGIPQSSLETLIRSPDNSYEVSQENENSSNSTLRHDQISACSSPKTTTTKNHTERDAALYCHPQRSSAEPTTRSIIDTPGRPDSDDHDNVSTPSDGKLDSPYSGDGHTVAMKCHGNGSDNRTIVLKGIPDRTTHSHIVAAVRGGALVDVFLRSRERTASISFADSRAAQEFFTYAKRQHLCILDKPVDVSWSDRQFILSNYIASQVSNGASRNILIRGIHPNLTESQIREDMEHIHNLVIISVTFTQGNAYISTNSVQKASYARNCMRSRMPYKVMRIEYYPDECAEPLPRIQHMLRRETPRPAKKLNPMANRFEMLHLDDSDADSDGTEELTSCASVTGGVNWANPIAV